MMRAALLLAWLLCACAHAADPVRLAPADLPLAVAGSRVPSNLLLNFSVSFVDAGAAYREPYLRGVDYEGYFNPRMCYRYPMRRSSAKLEEPDLDERSGYFAIDAPAGPQHQCRDAFSGNFLNWATASTLDLLRLGLTGGDRVIDAPAHTVLQRAWLPDGAVHPDFYAHPLYFPRKALITGEAGGAPSDVTPFSGDTLYVVSCRNRVLFSASAKGGGCDAPRRGAAKRLLVSDKALGEFNVRVQVCTAADAVSRPTLCRRRGRGFKPEGALQQADARVGVMGYRIAQPGTGQNVYGGVLRAPLKPLADSFGESPNPNAEWDASGVLAENPDGAAGSASGAIQAINRLGRGGVYPAADPGAELFYEALRYLQGRAPSSDTSAPDGGLPSWAQRTDPVAAACQRLVAATIGHASFIEDRYLPGNTRTAHLDAARPAETFGPASFDAMQAARRVGEFEAGAPRAPRPELARLDTLDTGPGGAGSYYLAGAAYWAHVNPVRSDHAVRVDSHALELGQGAGPGALQLAAKYGGFDDRDGDASPHGRNDREWSVDGKTPARFFAGADPLAIVPSVRALVAAGERQRKRVSGPMLAAGQGTAAPYLLQAGHDQAHWSGSLERRALPGDGAPPAWDAAELLDGDPLAQPPRAPSPAPAARAIYTLATSTVPFKWDSLSAAQRALLDGGAAVDGFGQARLAWLRGERSRELGQPGGTLRRRASVLGDIVHSTPVLAGAPSPAQQGEGYLDFYAAHKGRRAAVYVGANDGMLHAFDAASGAELFAYVPNALFPVLAGLPAPGYQHRASADGSPGVGEARLGTRWRTVLAAGMGMGARGVFALDISNPAAFDKGMGALWEFGAGDDPYMGHVRAAPQIARFRVGSKNGKPLFRDFAVVASGINSDEADGALFLLALDKPASAKWQLGVNYYRFVAPAADRAAANALSAPALAIGGDGSVLAAYAGDLQGSLWRFDFGGEAPWKGAAGERLFSARDADGLRQPIAHAPRIVFAPGGGYLVLFGTGRLIERTDAEPSSFAVQSLYAVHDKGDGAQHTRAALAPRLARGSGPYVIEGKALSYAGLDARAGWYLDFPRSRADGERAAGTPLLAGGVLFADTLAPGRDPCAEPVLRNYAIDALSGLAAGDGTAAPPVLATGGVVQGAATVPPLLLELGVAAGAPDPTGGLRAVRSIAILRAQAGGKVAAGAPVTLPMPAGRLSWREVANWPELHQEAGK
jgi:type IV pilus assembly protein PilY1